MATVWFLGKEIDSHVETFLKFMNGYRSHVIDKFPYEPRMPDKAPIMDGIVDRDAIRFTLEAWRKTVTAEEFAEYCAYVRAYDKYKTDRELFQASLPKKQIDFYILRKDPRTDFVHLFRALPDRLKSRLALFEHPAPPGLEAFEDSPAFKDIGMLVNRMCNYHGTFFEFCDKGPDYSVEPDYNWFRVKGPFKEFLEKNYYRVRLSAKGIPITYIQHYEVLGQAVLQERVRQREEFNRKKQEEARRVLEEQIKMEEVQRRLQQEEAEKQKEIEERLAWERVEEQRKKKAAEARAQKIAQREAQLQAEEAAKIAAEKAAKKAKRLAKKAEKQAEQQGEKRIKLG